MTECYDQAVVGRDQALTDSVNQALRGQVAWIDVGRDGANANVGAERAA